MIITGFRDRTDAGQSLAGRLGQYRGRKDVLVLGFLFAYVAILVNGLSFGIFFHMSNWLVIGFLRAESPPDSVP